jgi:glycosyltransferase involved in cell wall biosynthesis
MINLIQWGGRNNFSLSAALQENFDIHTFTSYHRDPDHLKSYTNYKSFYYGNHIAQKLGYSKKVDFDINFFFDKLICTVGKRINPQCLVSISDGTGIHSKIDAKVRVHEQTSCKLKLAEIRNKFGAHYNLDEIYNEQYELFKNVKNIIAPSEYVKSYISEFNCANNIIVAPYPVDIDLNGYAKSHDVVLETSLKKVMFVGRFEKAKGSDIIFKLAKLYPTIEFNVFGLKIEHYDDLQNLIYHGHVPKKALYKHYQCSDLFLFPSMSEGCSLAAIEAIGLGLPALISIQAGSIYSESTGFLLDAFEPEAWVETLKEIQHNNSHIAKRQILKNSDLYNSQKYSKRICNFFESLAE